MGTGQRPKMNSGDIYASVKIERETKKERGRGRKSELHAGE